MTEFEQMQIEQRKWIADVLEDINGALISMGGDIEALGECVDMNSFGIHSLRECSCVVEKQQQNKTRQGQPPLFRIVREIK